MDGDSSSWLLFAALILLILGGGYFAAAETAFASVNPIHIKQRVENGERKAKRAQYVLDHFNKALSTLLIGNNIMHIGTASLATYLVVEVMKRPDLTTASTLVTTVVVFLVAEMIPNRFIAFFSIFVVVTAPYTVDVIAVDAAQTTAIAAMCLPCIITIFLLNPIRFYFIFHVKLYQRNVLEM